MSDAANIKQDYFKNLEQNKLFLLDSTPDRIVFYFIFMPLIRHEINEFVQTWNAHRIRTQSGLPNSVGGIPDQLYYHPKEGIKNCGKIPNLNRLQQHAAQFENFGKSMSVGRPTFFTLFGFSFCLLRKWLIIKDVDAYLPGDTAIWCGEKLRGRGYFEPPRASDFIPTGPNKEFLIPQYYRHLVADAREHWKAGNQNPKLALLKVPRGGYGWVVSQRVVREIPDLAEDPRDLVEDAREERE